MTELRKITKEELKEVLRKHKLWLDKKEGGEKADLREADLSEADLRWADLRWADLCWADLSEADLSEADLDFSCVPLWCGSLKAHFDDRQIIQILYHAIKPGVQIKNTSEELKNELYKLSDLANKFHRVEECGRVICPPEETKEGEEE